MKLIIPQLDQYISKCEESGKKPIYENFIFEDSEIEIDRILFESYCEYKHGSRVLSIFEFQNIQSYSEFIGEDGVDDIEIEDNDTIQELENEITEAEGDENSIIIDFIFRRPRIIKAYKKIGELQKKNIDETNVRSKFADIDDQIEKLETQIKSGRLNQAKRDELEDKVAILQTKKSNSLDSLQKRADSVRDKINRAIENLEYNISKLATSEYLRRVADKQNVKNAIEIAEYRLKTADDASKEALTNEINTNKKMLTDIDMELKKSNELEKQSSEIDEINDEIKITYNSKKMSDDEKLQKVQELEVSRLDKTLEIGKKFQDAIKDPNKLKEKLNELLAGAEIQDTVSTFKGFEELINNKKEDVESGSGQGSSSTQGSGQGSTSTQESVNVYESVASRFSKLMNK